MHILGAQHASDPANPKSMGFISINGCSDIGAARHAHQLDSLFDVGAGCRVKGVSEMHILGAQHASDPANPTSLHMGFMYAMGAQTFVPHGTHINFDGQLDF